MKRTSKFKEYFLSHDYNEQHLEKEFNRTLDIIREASTRLPLLVTYHPIFRSFHLITKCHLSILHTLERLREALWHTSLIAFRHPRNLWALLVHVTVTITSHESPGNHLCGPARCKTCPIPMTTDEFSSHTTKIVLKVKFSASCK